MTSAQRHNARQDMIWDRAIKARNTADNAKLFREANIRIGGGAKFSDVALNLLKSSARLEETVNLIDAQNIIRAALRELEE